MVVLLTSPGVIKVYISLVRFVLKKVLRTVSFFLINRSATLCLVKVRIIRVIGRMLLVNGRCIILMPGRVVNVLVPMTLELKLAKTTALVSGPRIVVTSETPRSSLSIMCIGPPLCIRWAASLGLLLSIALTFISIVLRRPCRWRVKACVLLLATYPSLFAVAVTPLLSATVHPKATNGCRPAT